MDIQKQQANQLNSEGIKLAQQAKFEEAIPYFQQALHLYPNNATIYFNIAIH